MLVNQHKPLAERGEIIFISYIIEWEWREHSWPAPTKTPFRHEAHPDGTTKAQRPGLHISPNASIDNNNSSNKITFQAQDASCSPNRHMTRACTPNKRKQRMHEVIIGSHKHLAGTTHLVLPKAMTRFGQNHIFIGVYGVYTVILVGKSPYIRSCTVYIGIRFWPTQAMTHLFSPLLRHNASCSPQSNDAPVLPITQARRILFYPTQHDMSLYFKLLQLPSENSPSQDKCLAHALTSLYLVRSDRLKHDHSNCALIHTNRPMWSLF